ncbi:class I SAM-dependent methyltransferase [Pseudactinotalea sp. Z1748]|uniref:class I SAM-dependent methyltransferase n=1 Tax=Pseudactinotalea sp. Z1748 TaxID=3413027 RepID=UPI003C7A2435
MRRRARLLGWLFVAVLASAGVVAVWAGRVMWLLAAVLALVVFTAALLVELGKRAIDSERLSREVLRRMRKQVALAESGLQAEADRRAGLLLLHDELARLRVDIQSDRDGLPVRVGTEIAERIKRSQPDLLRKVSYETREQLRDMEAFAYLYPQVHPAALMPPLGRWSMDVRNVAHLTDLIRQRVPRRVLELGGGASTVWLGYILREIDARMLSVDHDEKFASITRGNILRHGLEAVVDVQIAPLKESEIAGRAGKWYSAELFTGCGPIDLLIVDGPPGRSSRFARLPAIEFLKGELAEGALVVLDDADRPAEAAAVASWIKDYGMEQIDIGVSGLAVLQWSST